MDTTEPVKNRSFHGLAALLALLLCLPILASANADYGTIPEYNDEEVIERLKTLNSDVVEPRYEGVVKSYIKTYVMHRRRNAEIILGRAAIYFPIFEKQLRDNHMPAELKYLAIVESALNPRITSRAGARGLWQFMPYTGREYGLRVDNEIDERCDPQKSTAAAIRYLGDLHDRFDDWALALAAYNAGPGRINSAIKRARSKDYWKIRRFLPRETANYVPAFIAAAYLTEHYKAHNIQPEWPGLDLQITEAVEIHEHLSFFRVAQLTGIALETIRSLNPAFTGDYIPAAEKGHFLNMPKRVVANFRELYFNTSPENELQLLALSAPVAVSSQEGNDELTYEEIVVTACEGDKIEDLAMYLDCEVYQLQVWNKLLLGEPSDWQEIMAYRPKAKENAAPEGLVRRAAPEALPEIAIPKMLLPEVRASLPALSLPQMLVHKTDKREKLSDLCSRYPGIDVKEVAELNGIEPHARLRPGTEVVLLKW